MTSEAKKVYDRKKKLKAERLLREEEAALAHDNKELDAEILASAAVVALENIAFALATIAAKMPAGSDND